MFFDKSVTCEERRQMQSDLTDLSEFYCPMNLIFLDNECWRYIKYSRYIRPTMRSSLSWETRRTIFSPLGAEGQAVLLVRPSSEIISLRDLAILTFIRCQGAIFEQAYNYIKFY